MSFSRYYCACARRHIAILTHPFCTSALLDVFVFPCTKNHLHTVTPRKQTEWRVLKITTDIHGSCCCCQNIQPKRFASSSYYCRIFPPHRPITHRSIAMQRIFHAGKHYQKIVLASVYIPLSQGQFTTIVSHDSGKEVPVQEKGKTNHHWAGI